MGIKLFGKNVFQLYKHHIMKIDYKDLINYKINSTFKLRKINFDNIDEELKPIGTTISLTNLRKLLSINKTLVEGFIFEGMDSNKVATIWVMYKGGNDLEYKIRNIDAYIFDVYVNKQFRGNGYAGEMISQLMDYLHKKEIETAYLAVSFTNQQAYNAYKNTGFTTVYDKKFVRALKVNIPYHIL